MDTNQKQPTAALSQAPQMPVTLALPLKWMPPLIQHRIIEQTLNHFFKPALEDHALDFLQDRIINVHIKDAYIRFALRLHQNKLQVSDCQNKADLALTTDVYTLLQLVSQQEDADGLFFSRRLDSQGDTELGLYVKNFLAALDPDETRALSIGMKLSQHILRLIEFKRHKLTNVIS